MSALGIDYGRLEEAKRRLARAGALVDTIAGAARELDGLVDDPDDPVAYALDVAGRINGSAPALPSSAPASAPHGSRDDSAAGPAPVLQPPPPPPPAQRAPRGRAVDVVLAYFEAHPREWLAPGDLDRALGIPVSSLRKAIRDLCKTETLEPNEHRTSGRKYRLDPGLAEELEQPAAERDDVYDDEPEVADDEGDDGSTIDPGAGDTGRAELEDDDEDDDAPAESTRADVARDLERLSGLAPPRRSAASSRPSGANGAANRLIVAGNVALSGPQGIAREELKQRVKLHLLEEASTISELAEALEVERRELAPVVLELEAGDDDVVKVPNATRNRGETIYSNIA